MARISYTNYSNSVLATVLSFLGSAIGTLSLVGGVIAILCGEFGEGVPLLIGGFAIAVALTGLAEWISKTKYFNTWWKTEVVQKNWEPEIRKSQDSAIYIYKLYPVERTLKKIETMNPQAAAYIRENNIK